MKIGVMGAVGSFSELAGKKFAADFLVQEYEIVPLVSAKNVLAAVEAGSVERGVFPIENSNAGIVIEAVHAMAAHCFRIEHMFELDVHHMLLVKPGVTSSHITTISSHDQALKQCRMYLKRCWPQADIIPYEDTAKAAADLGEGTLSDSTAVIAPSSCAQLYNLEILEESIQDLKYNYTTFLAVMKRI